MSLFTCIDCGTSEDVKGSNASFRCSSCRNTDSRHEAAKAVQQAIGSGQLPHPSELDCADCGDEACFYDHRDYNKPLCVDPVCRKCNSRRGPAFPVFACIERKIARGKAPYTSGKAFRKLCALMGAPEIAADVPARVDVGLWIQAWPRIKAAHAAASGAV